MLQKKLRSLKEKWVNLGFTKRFLIIAIIIAIIIGGIDIAIDHEPLMQEENYAEMHNMVNSMIISKSTEIEFDTSKVNDYTVIHKENGGKIVRINGDRLEKIEVELTSNYQIKSLSKNGYGAIILFWVIYVSCHLVGGAITSAILFGIYAALEKIVIFFKKSNKN